MPARTSWPCVMTKQYPEIVTQNAVLAQALACVRDFRALEIPYDEYSMHLVRVFTRRFALPLNA